TPENPKRTPPRAAQPAVSAAQSTAPIPTMPDMSGVEGGGTQLLPGAAARPRNAAPAPPRPAARPASIRKGEVGDTLVDMDGGGPPRPAADDAPGATAMLKPGQALPPPRRPQPKRDDPVPPDTEEEYEAPGGTAILGAAPQRPAPKKTPGPPRRQAATNIMTPEESEAAQREAQEKLEQAQQAVLRTRTRGDKTAELTQAKSSRAMWIALGVGTLAAVALIVGLLFLFFADDSGGSGARARRAAKVPEAQATPVPDPAQDKS